MDKHELQTAVEELHQRYKGLTDGQVATYIPELGRADPEDFGISIVSAEGQVFEAATFGCPHCGGTVVKNPLRTRERATCYKCSSHVCDVCAGVMQEPDYVHLPLKQVVDLVNSGKYTMSGSMGRPILTPTGD